MTFLKVTGKPTSKIFQSYFWKKARRAWKSDTKDPSGFREGYDFLDQSPGTLFAFIAFWTCIFQKFSVVSLKLILMTSKS